MRIHTLTTSALLLAALHPAHAGWLTISNPPASNEVNLAVGIPRTLTLPPLGGTATVTLLSATGTGAFLLRSFPFHPAGFFSEYPNNGLDPTGADQYVVAGFGGTNATVSVQFDFTGLAGGVLPAGSIFTVLDIDTFEALTNLQAFGPGSNLLTTAWLQFIAQFDANGATGGTATNFATFQFINSAYQFTPPNVNSDLPTLYFRTTQDIALLQFDGRADLGPRGYGVAFAVSDVPEPSTLALTGLALVAAAFRFRGRARLLPPRQLEHELPADAAKGE
jgi:hypothetical protein